MRVGHEPRAPVGCDELMIPDPKGGATEVSEHAMRPTTGTRHVVVMGVSGCGKSTLAAVLATATGWTFADADAFHPEANVARMSAGTALDDSDRRPWLGALAAWTAGRAGEGQSTIMACSALKRAYRDVLRSGPPSVTFVHLDGDPEVIRRRVAARPGNFMPVGLLDSQLATLEPLGAGEDGFVVDLGLGLEDQVVQCLKRLEPLERRA
jgi:gluconokinase